MWPVLCMLAWTSLGMAAPAFANHFPPHVAYLNGTQLVIEIPCSDPATREQRTCRVYHDARAGQRYYVRFRGSEVVGVLAFRNGVFQLLFAEPPAAQGREWRER